MYKSRWNAYFVEHLTQSFDYYSSVASPPGLQLPRQRQKLLVVAHYALLVPYMSNTLDLSMRVDAEVESVEFVATYSSDFFSARRSYYVVSLRLSAGPPFRHVCRRGCCKPPHLLSVAVIGN